MKRSSAFLIATLLLAGCGTTSSLSTSADRLDHSAQQFYERVYSQRAPTHATDDAAALAEATRDFNHEVDRSRSRDELRSSFDRVAERYHHVRQQLEERDPRYSDASLEFDRVTAAYLDVDRTLNYPDSRAHSGSPYRN